MTEAKTKEIVKLGTDEVFVLRDQGGEIRAFEQHLDLNIKNGGIIQIVQAKGQPFVVTAQGYEFWAEAAGASVIMPRRVVVDGKWMGNPCVQRDAHDKIICVYARAVAFRYTSKGIPQVSDWSTILDLEQYRMIDLLAKAKNCQQAFKLLPIGDKVTDDGTWCKYYFDEAAALWVNTQHPEALTWYSQIRQRQKKAVDFAQTFAKRNALKHLSALQKAPGPQWTIRVLCWRPTGDNLIKWDHTQYKMLQERVENFVNGDGDLEGAEITQGTETATDTDEYSDLEKETDVEDAIDDGDETQAAEPNNTTEPPGESQQTDMEVIKNNLLLAQESFEDVFNKVCANNNINPATLKDADPKTMPRAKCEKILEEISQELDKQNQ